MDRKGEEEILMSSIFLNVSVAHGRSRLGGGEEKLGKGKDGK